MEKYGYAGKILEVDLTKAEFRIRILDQNLALNYIGGKGFGAKLLPQLLSPGADAYDPSNPLMLITGPLTGLRLSGAAKFCAVFKSPLTGIWGESQCGGFFGPELKKAGFDLVIIHGRSPKPCYLLIRDGEAEILDGSHLWGLNAFQTEQAIKSDHGKEYQVLSIGPAGENLVRFACICHSKGRQLGRCGGGALMGSKKLKAIAVNGDNEFELAHPERFQEIKSEIEELARERLTSLRNYGTPWIMSATNATGTLPTRYWSQLRFDGYDSICAEVLKQKYIKRSTSCHACRVGCGKITRVDSGKYAGTEVEGPEYETLFAFGPLCGVSDPEAIIKSNELCDLLGLDTISTGNAIGFSMECYRNGIITERDTHGLRLEFGDQEAMLALIEAIAYRRGIGNILAEGVKRAAELLGGNAPRLAVHVKGLEPPGYDPRGLKGVALAYAVSVRGACHMRHVIYRPNLTGEHPFEPGKLIDRLSCRDQPEILVELEDFYTLVDSMVLCRFLCLPGIGPILWDELLQLYSAVTGIQMSKQRFISIAREIHALILKFNSREGVTREHDVLPDRLMSPVNGKSLDPGELMWMLERYYQLRT